MQEERGERIGERREERGEERGERRGEIEALVREERRGGHNHLVERVVQRERHRNRRQPARLDVDGRETAVEVEGLSFRRGTRTNEQQMRQHRQRTTGGSDLI